MGRMGVPLHVIVLISEVAVGSRAVGCFTAVKLSVGCRRSSARGTGYKCHVPCKKGVVRLLEEGSK